MRTFCWVAPHGANDPAPAGVSNLHWGAPTAPVMWYVNNHDVAGDGFGGALVTLITGGDLSTSHVYEAVAIVPPAFCAWTEKVCEPSASAETACDALLSHGPYTPSPE